MLKSVDCEQEVTYYKASDTMGVASKKRICIAIGAAHKPANAYDAITDNRKQSDILKEEAMHCDTWQAWSRVKDPSAKVTSIVFSFGVTLQDCTNIVNWGIKREVKINRNKKKLTRNRTVETSCDLELEKPKVIQISEDSDFLKFAYEWKEPSKRIEVECKSATKMEPGFLLLYYNRNRGSKMVATLQSCVVFSESELLQNFISRQDAYAEQSLKGSYFKVPGEINQTLLQNHANGEITIGSYCLDTDNTVCWMCFDVDAHESEDDTPASLKEKQLQADSDMETFCSFFDEEEIPYVLEASGSPHSYHIWILLERVEAWIAKSFGEAIMKHLDLDHELFPKQPKLKSKQGYGNLVKLPFAVNKKNNNKSKIFHDGEWIEHIPESGFEINKIDISGWAEYAEENKKKQSQYKKIQNKKIRRLRKDGQIRPCIANALNNTLTGTQGHAMRIAICREYSSVAGYSDEQIAELFETQPDYDFNISLQQVQSITQVEMNPWKCETLRNKCSKYMDCLGCKFNM